MIVIIPTCAAYGDVLGPFVFFFGKFWKDCPYRKVFINSTTDYPGFENFRTATDAGWVANLLEFIRKENVEENILLLHDDYVLTEPVCNADVAKAEERVADKIGYVRLIPYSDNEFNSGQGWKWPSKVSFDSHFNLADIDRNAPNKITRLPISHQPAIWNSAFIKAFFNPAWSPWQQEVLASREYCANGTIGGIPCDYQFLTTRNFVYAYVNGVRDGKYSREFVELVEHTPELQPFHFVRDVAIPVEELGEQRFKTLLSRQTDGTYPRERYE